jgi:ribose transport system substrate-binding protein
MTTYRGLVRPATVTLGAALLMLSACAKSEDSSSNTPATPASAAAQVVQ